MWTGWELNITNTGSQRSRAKRKLCRKNRSPGRRKRLYQNRLQLALDSFAGYARYGKGLSRPVRDAKEHHSVIAGLYVVHDPDVELFPVRPDFPDSVPD